MFPSAPSAMQYWHNEPRHRVDPRSIQLDRRNAPFVVHASHPQVDAFETARHLRQLTSRRLLDVERTVERSLVKCAERLHAARLLEEAAVSAHVDGLLARLDKMVVTRPLRGPLEHLQARATHAALANSCMEAAGATLSEFVGIDADADMGASFVSGVSRTRSRHNDSPQPRRTPVPSEAAGVADWRKAGASPFAGPGSGALLSCGSTYSSVTSVSLGSRGPEAGADAKLGLISAGDALHSCDVHVSGEGDCQRGGALRHIPPDNGHPRPFSRRDAQIVRAAVHHNYARWHRERAVATKDARAAACANGTTAAQKPN